MNVYAIKVPDRSLLSSGNKDTYFKPEGVLHGLLSFFALVYFVFWHGPRSPTAPMSLLFDKIFFSVAKKSEVPVIPTFTKKTQDNDIAVVESLGTAVDSTTLSTSGNADSINSPQSSKDIAKKPDEESQITVVDGESATAEKETQIDENPEEIYADAVKNFKVFDDEKDGVRYSWSLFYIFMILGSLSIMIGMTGLTE